MELLTWGRFITRVSFIRTRKIGILAAESQSTVCRLLKQGAGWNIQRDQRFSELVFLIQLNMASNVDALSLLEHGRDLHEGCIDKDKARFLVRKWRLEADYRNRVRHLLGA